MSKRPTDKPKRQLELALVAAVLDPALAKAKPWRAVRLASQLLAAAQKHAHRKERENRRFDLAYERTLKLFPYGERVSIDEAFAKWGTERYKTKTGFAAALRKEKLTTEFPVLTGNWWKEGLAGKSPKFEEVTSKRAVDDLLRRQTERQKLADRLRKKAVQAKRPKNRHRNSNPEKRNAAREKRKSNG